MTLSVLSSNRVENLQARLAQQLAAEPPGDPFGGEIIVVPTYAMARWLNLRFAKQFGVAANIRYPLAGEWIWQMAAAVLDDVPRQDPYAGTRLAWTIFRLLPGLIDSPAFTELRTYLADDNGGIKRWQLAQRIGSVFEAYQRYRPQRIDAWTSGAEQHWQAELWRATRQMLGQMHRSEMIARAVRRLDRENLRHELPPRISLFAISSLAPAVVEFIHALARRTQVAIYQHNPTDQYWADLVSEREHARQRLQHPERAVYLDTGNSLLSSWGRQGQAMQDLLLTLGPVTEAEHDDYQPPAGDSLLGAVQHSLFTLAPVPASLRADDSLSVHICHSPMRECQVLHDYLLDLLQRQPELRCEDILVMVPEISRYAPYIEAVFQQDTSANRPNLAWNISDISVSDDHPLAALFLQLLRLPRSRFTRSEVLAYLDCDDIRARFAIDDDMLEQIHRLLEVARVRWGIDAGQRGELGLPALDDNTWSQAWQRLFAGYAMVETPMWQGIAPIDEAGGDASLALAQLRHLFDRLVYWRQQLGFAGSSADWQRRLHRLLDEFFAPPGGIDERLQPLRNAINELSQAGETSLDPALIGYWMEQRLRETRQPGRLYSGGISFCGMQPLRNIPFPVICVLGMHDEAFPRRDRSDEFDLMADECRAGDPRRGDEDRYLMLETLLCARQYLYFSYCGRSLKDNSECQPSVLLRELLDYLDSGAQPGEAQRSLSEAVCVLHPMQAFAARNFTPAAPGYDRHWFQTALELRQRSAPIPPPAWNSAEIEAAEGDDSTIDLQSMIRFFSHPIRYFYTRRLGLRLTEVAQNEDEECFSLQGLEKWHLATLLAGANLDGSDTGWQRFAAAGMLPHGSAAANEWRALNAEFGNLFMRLREYRDLPSQRREVDCRLGNGYSLVGAVDYCFAGLGLMHFSASKTVKSRARREVWLNHLALCASKQLAARETSHLLLPSSAELRFAGIDAERARALLRGYAEIFVQGQRFPLPLFANTSCAFAAEADPAAARQAAQKAWLGGDYQGAPAGESDDPFIRLALHNNLPDPLQDPLFAEYANQVYAPALLAEAKHD